jgi:hypothetical protein
MTRKLKFYPTDPRDVPGDKFAFVRKHLTDPALIALRLAALPQPDLQPVAASNTLVDMLRLSPQYARHLEGADRLNFWRNGTLNVQVQHGNRSIKLRCPEAVVTDAQLVEHFTTWGWQQLSGKLYFRSNSASLVQL